MARRALSKLRALRTRAARRIAGACLVFAAALPCGARAQGVFEQLQVLQARGDLTEAMALASACSTSLERAQARLFVLHHAGDLAGALSAGLEGLRAEPNDPWLLERTTTLALDLGATELALELLPRFETRAASAGAQPIWSAQADALRTRTDERAAQAQQVARSLKRAQVTAALAGLLALACLIWACRPERSALARAS